MSTFVNNKGLFSCSVDFREHECKNYYVIYIIRRITTCKGDYASINYINWLATSTPGTANVEEARWNWMRIYWDFTEAMRYWGLIWTPWSRPPASPFYINFYFSDTNMNELMQIFFQGTSLQQHQPHSYSSYNNYFIVVYNGNIFADNGEKTLTLNSCLMCRRELKTQRGMQQNTRKCEKNTSWTAISSSATQLNSICYQWRTNTDSNYQVFSSRNATHQQSQWL